MSMKQLYILCLLLFSSLSVWGQTKKAFVKAGEIAYEQKNYYAAMDYYLEAIEFDSSDVDMYFRAAEAARHFQSYEKAAELYTFVLSKDNEAKYPSAAFYLGYVQQLQGSRDPNQYAMAKRNYELYLSQYEGDDQRLTEKAKKEIAFVEWAQERIDHPEPSITVSNVGPEINSIYSDFAAILDGDDIVYTSVKFFAKDRKKYSDKQIGKVLRSSANAESMEFDEINEDNRHTSHVTYNTNKSKMFYTLCDWIDEVNVRCDIYYRTVGADGSLGSEVKLPAPINQDSFTSTQPNIAFDKYSGQEVLYFVSDRPGKGGLDIWTSNITGMESFSNPVNLSEVNTAYDDISPFYHNNTQVLYYSTNGDMTLGGYDVYRSIKETSGFQRPENVGAPINGSYNDAFYVLSDDSKTSLFSSNRLGSQYIDDSNKSCCFDIYRAEIGELEINLNALTYDAKSLDSLEGVTVQLVCAETGEVFNTLTNDRSNDHIFSLVRGKEYYLISNKRGYHPDTLGFNTNTIFSSQDIVRQIYLKRSSLDLEVFTFDKISKEALPGTTITLENLTDGTIQVVTVTNENANDFVFEIIPLHSYRVTASRDRYYDDSLEFVARDDNGSGKIRKELYLARRDLNVYLPLRLYFDNDIPNTELERKRRTESLTTNVRFSDAFDKYVVRQADFRSRYSRGLSGDDKKEAESRVDEFFEGDLKGGFNTFVSFLEYLEGQLQDGNRFDISLKGYASPRAEEKYNLALSQRRVVSVQNELNAYNDGVLLKYIENGQLKITELSYGETLAPDNVVDRLYDRRNSVYSPEASRERRVEIVEIKQGEF